MQQTLEDCGIQTSSDSWSKQLIINMSSVQSGQFFRQEQIHLE